MAHIPLKRGETISWREEEALSLDIYFGLRIGYFKNTPVLSFIMGPI